MASLIKSQMFGYFRKVATFVLCAVMVLQTTLSGATFAKAVPDLGNPNITSVLAVAAGGKFAQAIGDTLYTNDTSPQIAATYNDTGGPGIDVASASIQIDGDTADFDSRNTSGISASLSDLPDGTYAVSVVVSDTAANQTVADRSLVIDTINPAVPTISTPTAITSNNQTPTISGTAEANSSVKIYDGSSQILSTQANSSGNYSIISSALVNGNHALTAKAIDRAGNESGLSAVTNYNVDIVAPAIPVLTVISNTNNPRPTFNWSDADVTAVGYNLQISTNSGFTTTLVDLNQSGTSYTPNSDLPSTTIYWRVASVDAYLNQSDFSGANSFVIDSNKPYVTSFGTSPVSPAGAGTMTITVDFNKTMNATLVPTITVGGHAATTIWSDSDTAVATISIPSDHSYDGTDTVSIFGARDLFGNIMDSDSSHSIVIDTTAPVITLNGDSTVNLEAGTAYSELGASWTDAVDGSGAATVSGDTVDIHTVGDYNINYNYTDAAGNVAATVSRTVKVRDNSAPVISNLTPANGSSTANVWSIISATYSDNGSGIDKNSIALDVDGWPLDPSAVIWSGNQFSYVSDSAFDDGTHDASVSILDKAGNVSVVTAWSFTISTAPTISSVNISGGRVNAPYINNTNTGLQIVGAVIADDGGAGDFQTINLYSNGSLLASTMVLPSLTSYAINLSAGELAALTATDGIKNLQVERVGHTGNVSAISAATSVTVDITAPVTPDSSKISVAQNTPSNNDTIAGSTGAVSSDSVSVLLYDKTDSLIGTYSPNSDGSFGPISIGDNIYDTVKVATRDAAGNESGSVTKLNDVVAPDAPSITSPSSPTYSQNPNVTISGTAEAGTTVYIINSHPYNSGVTGIDGKFSILVSIPVDGSYNFQAYAVDAAGNTSGYSTAVNYVLDRIAPTMVSHLPEGLTNNNLAPISVSWTEDGSGFAAAPTRTLKLGLLSKTTVWNGGSKVMTYTPSSASADGTRTVTATITDRAGNVGTATFSFTIDTIKPVISLNGAAEMTIEIGSTYLDAGATASDSHDGNLTGSIITANTVNPNALGDYTVKYDVSDAAGNAAVEVVRTVHVRDTINPTVDAGADKLTNASFTQTATADGTGTPIALYSWSKVSGPGAITFGTSNAISTTVSADADGTYIIKISVADGGGNLASDTFQLIWDTTAPRVLNVTSIAANATYKTGDVIPVTVQFSEPVNLLGGHERIAMNISGVTRYADYASGSGTATLTFNYTVQSGDGSPDLNYASTGAYDLNGDTATDAAGNSANVTLPATASTNSLGGNKDIIIDALAPVITLIGGTETREVHSSYVDAGATATDLYDGNVTSHIVTTNPVNIDVVGDYTVRYNVSDSVGNPAAEVTRTVHIVDTTKPIISLTGGETTVAQGSVWTDPGYSATDNYDQTVTVVISGDSVNTALLGDYTIKYNSTDAHSNAAIQKTRLVHVTDQTAPTIDAHANMTVEATSSAGAVVNYTAPSAIDNVDATVPAVCAPASGSTFPLGDTTVTCNKTDAAGNHATPTTFTVTVKDTTPPVIATHADVTAEATSSAGASVTYTAPSATDNYDATAPAVCTPASGSVFSIGITTVNCTKTDSSGNTTTSSFSVHVQDTTAPTIDSISGSTGTTGEITTVTVNAHDNVAPTKAEISFDSGAHWAVMTGSSSPFTYNVAIPENSIADINYLVRVSDAASYSITSGTQTITVSDNDAPAGNIGLIASTATNISDPTLYTRTTALKLTLNATDNIAVSTMAFKDDHSTGWSTPVAYAASSSRAYTLSSSTSGVRTVYVQYCDAAAPANCSEASAQITFDSAAPSTVSGATDGTYTNNKQLSFSWSATHDLPATGVTSGLQYYQITVQKQAPDLSWSNVTGLIAVNAGLVTSYQLSTAQSASLVDGNYRINIQARDNAGNLSGAAYSDGVILDTTAPVITLNTLTKTTYEAGIDTYSEPGATWTDAVDGTGAASVLGTVNTSVVGIYTIHYNYTDHAGNAATQIARTITVVDTTKPVITAHDNLTAEATSHSGAVVTYTAPNAADNVDATAPANCSAVSGSTFGLGINTVTCNKTDANGNAATSTTFTITVTDTTKPVITLSGVAEMTVAQGSVWTDPGYSATDNYDGTISSSVVVGGSVNTAVLGDYTLTYNVSDTHHNAATQKTRLVHVADQTAPVVTVTPVVTKDTTPALSGTIDDATATVSVRVNGVDYPAVNNGSTWSIADNIISALPDGIYDVVVTATDTHGNIGHDATSAELKIDNTAPAAIADSATPTGNTTNRMPTISIALSDAVSGINSGTVVMRVNGVAVAANYNPSTGVVSFTPVRDLTLRKYTVTIDAKDNLGNTMPRYSFSFTVVAP